MADKREFDRIVQGALDNRFLQTALTRATGSFKTNRINAVSQLPEFEDLRKRARDAKDRALGRLDENLTLLEKSVTEKGGKVFWANDGSEVIDYITRLATEKGLKSVVKGKSMLSEEIYLNPALEKAGMEVFETDLGEYIIQLAGERPSHIIGPAIHKTKEEVGKLFQEKLGIDYTDVPEEMTKAVRDELRRRFIQADLGITGVNFAVADTGTIVLLENEGNIRMSTTVPKVHVAVMGLEKVVANWDDLYALLRILPVAAVGQRLPSYVSFLTGPGRVEGEGPEELHLIIMDGFRSEALGDPLLRQVLRCLRCGACLNFCPVYRKIGGHSYPWVYSGPIGVVLTGAAFGEEAAGDIASASTLCRMCATVCPVMIDLPGLILELRKRLAAKDSKAEFMADVAARVIGTPFGYDMVGRAMETGARAMIDPAGGVRRGPRGLKELGNRRKIRRPAVEPFHRSLFKGDES